MLVWTWVQTGGSRAQEIVPQAETGSGPLVSGLFRQPAPSSRKDSEIPLFGDQARSAFVVPLQPDRFATAANGAADLASRIVAAEGGPEPNPVSSAAGYGQFLRGTCLEMFTRAYPRLARQLSDEQILALRVVKPLAIELTGHYTQQNASSLRRIGLPATDASLSLAHFVGAAGAINILASPPDELVENVLGRAVVMTNPFMKEMSAEGLHRWAAGRVGTPEAPPRRFGAQSRFEPELEPLKPSEDFLVDGRTPASRALADNRNATAKLQGILEADAKIGAGGAAQLGLAATIWLASAGVDPAALLRADPAALKAFEKSAARLVIETVRSLATRPAYRELKPLGGSALQRTVTRDIAFALITKMRRENATIIAILRHRRGGGAGAGLARGGA